MAATLKLMENSDKVNILVVDDRADKLLAVEAVLEPLNENLVTARSGKEALRQLLHRDFAVILLDVAMPGMDGFETAALIRKRERCEHTPIIFITSISNSESSVFQGYSLGAVDYIITPIVPDVLRTKVRVFVDLHRNTDLVRRQAEQLRLAEGRKHQRELAAAADRIEAETKRNRFFTLALDLLGIGDFSGRLLQVNPNWQQVLGYTEDELKGGQAIELVHRDDRDAVAQRLELLRQGLPVEYFEIRCRHQDGSYRWIGWTAASFPEEKLVYVFGRDVTRRRAAEDEVSVLNAELTRRISDLTDINKELESFCYSISHDLRAPLRSIASFTQVVLNQYNGSLAGEGHDYLRRVESAAKYMDRLLMDLLEYSRLGRAEMKLEAVDLESAFTDVLSSIHDEIQTRKAQVDIRKPLGSVVAHSATVRQILYNLIANALKFVSTEKNPSIRVWTEPQSDSLRIWVADDGIGIAPQFHKKIFGLFQKLHSQKIYPGTGVGLAMVQKGVERMGGRIGVESDLGKGSRFWFELRAANDPPPHSSSPAPELQPAQAD